MTEEELNKELSAIEEDIKKICVKFEGIFMRHGLVKGEPDNFWQIIIGNLQIYGKGMDLKELLEAWSKSYTSKAEMLVRYVNETKEWTNKIYSDDEKAEEIVRQLEQLSSTQDKKSEKEILRLLESIKQKCRQLMAAANSLQKLIDEMNTHSQELDDKIKKPGVNLEELKNTEYKYASGVRKRMMRTGRMGWRIVCRIYSEDKKAEHIFKKIKSHFN